MLYVTKNSESPVFCAIKSNFSFNSYYMQVIANFDIIIDPVNATVS